MLCLLSDYAEGELIGISLVNGRVGSCSHEHCGVRPLSLAEAVAIRGSWPPAHLVEWYRAQGRAFRLPQGQFRATEVEAGQAGLPEAEVAAILSRLRPASAAPT